MKNAALTYQSQIIATQTPNIPKPKYLANNIPKPILVIHIEPTPTIIAYRTSLAALSVLGRVNPKGHTMEACIP